MFGIPSSGTRGSLLKIKDEDVWDLYKDGAGYLIGEEAILPETRLVHMRAALNRVSGTRFLFNDIGVEEIEDEEHRLRSGSGLGFASTGAVSLEEGRRTCDLARQIRGRDNIARIPQEKDSFQDLAHHVKGIQHEVERIFGCRYDLRGPVLIRSSGFCPKQLLHTDECIKYVDAYKPKRSILFFVDFPGRLRVVAGSAGHCEYDDETGKTTLPEERVRHFLKTFK